MNEGDHIEGHVPEHFFGTLRMRGVDDEDFGPSLEMDLRPEVSNPHGSVHGGALMTLAECGAAGVAVRAGGSENIVATDCTARFLAPVKVGPARVVGTVLRAGRRNIVVQVEVLDVGAARALVATATFSYARLDAS